jgi:hypothetical protein
MHTLPPFEWLKKSRVCCSRRCSDLALLPASYIIIMINNLNIPVMQPQQIFVQIFFNCNPPQRSCG